MTLVAKGLFEGGVQEREGCYRNRDVGANWIAARLLGWLASIWDNPFCLPSMCVINTDILVHEPGTMLFSGGLLSRLLPSTKKGCAYRIVSKIQNHLPRWHL
ncbi:hypothetical protein L798_08441 [Zootermopsis nevadensis]|uniref:Uncharacterized protein n=1 Tax=Zootermopsis nevadensis TaxID=136037 RepID=A0A067RCN3_ZOONE|nr:hypothetical protein L798_08441 [Zootermopsis nevadensis]